MSGVTRGSVLVQSAPTTNLSNTGSGGSAQIKDGKSEEPDRMATKNRRRRRGEDSKMIQQLFPGVRSLALMPMWDSGRERFFAGSVVVSVQGVAFNMPI